MVLGAKRVLLTIIFRLVVFVFFRFDIFRFVLKSLLRLLWFERFNADGSLMGRTNLDKSVW